MSIKEKDKIKGLITKVNRILQEIEEAKSERDVKKGRKQETLVQLEREFGLKTIEECETRMNTLDMQITRRSKQIDKLMNEIEEKYKI